MTTKPLNLLLAEWIDNDFDAVGTPAGKFEFLSGEIGEDLAFDIITHALKMRYHIEAAQVAARCAKITTNQRSKSRAEFRAEQHQGLADAHRQGIREALSEAGYEVPTPTAKEPTR